jgi:hypothetical protein
MNTMWVVVGLGIAGIAFALVMSWLRGGLHSDMGTVSQQWITEHRLGTRPDSRR